ncbi:MAG: GAF domain-containing sensor histidine kinase [Candidatus Dormibacteraceae bacterium]
MVGEALSTREREVAALVADGLTNAAIGLRLHVSHWTVASHVAHVLGKLGFRSRAQIAAWYLAGPAEAIDEPARLRALRYYQVLDSEPEPAFDRITALAARLTRSPIALISFVDEQRQWFKSAHGIVVKQTPRRGGFCAAAITCEDPTVIPDATANDHFARHPMVVGPPGIRLYAGAPLTTADGHNLGTICVMDTVPRDLTEEEVAILADLAGLVMAQLDQRMSSLHLLESERMRREARRHAERMEEVERVKSEFLLLGSHELRAPLSVVRGYISMISDGSLGEVPEAVLSVMPIISNKVVQIDQLINQMLASARLEDGQSRSSHDRFDLRPVVEETARGLFESAEIAAGPSLKLPNQPVVVIGDPADLAIIVGNLLSNAIKFSPPGGDIDCSVRTLGRNAIVEVTDRGMGIEKKDLPKLFSRFGRLVTPENSHIPGYGLGLYLCRRLARTMGGDMTAASTPGAGSTFTLTLPLA